MLHFFRKLRRDLLANSQFFKYLKYAIGEIVLVVIGILIALQINNWNEENKAIKQEIMLLKNIKKDINLDTLDLSSNYNYHRNFYAAEQALLNLLISDTKEIPIDEIDYNDALGAVLWTALHNSTFTTLQNNNPELLKNNEIRKEISRFYDYYQKVIIDMSNNLEDFNLYRSKLTYFKKYFRVVPSSRYNLFEKEGPEILDHNLYKNEIILYDLEGAKNDQAFILTMNEVLLLRRAFIDFHKEVLQEISRLNEHIDKEILKLENS